MKKILNVVNHTHWDREWYESFETFRGKLAEAIKLIINGLDNGQFQYFMLDGQTIILEDLKEVLEEETFYKLEAYIKSGRIDIGPWYVLPDEFLVSGESLIRNLKLGIEISKGYGKEDFIGYLPDTFGHISQLPQIFKSLGINWSLLFRGVKAHKSEVYFIGGDGTKIKSFVLPLWEGYYNHFLTYEDYKDRLSNYINKVSSFSTTNELLLLNGADHLIPYSNLKDRLEELEKELDISIEQISLIDYAKKFEEVDLEDKIVGEQRDESKAYILTNVASSRSYLKIQNQKLEDYITYIAEPMELIKSLITSEYKYNYIKHIWKTLLQNHPHDSICGCSIDKVHKEMEIRNAKIEDMLKSITHYAVKNIIESNPIDNKKIYVFNPQPYKVKYTVKTKVILPTHRGFIKLTKENGEKVEYAVLAINKKQIFKADIDLEPNWYDAKEYEILFDIECKGIGFTAINIEDAEDMASNVSYESVLENSYIKAWLNEKGYINLLNKENNKVYEDINQWVSSLDAGDEYTYSPPFNDIISKAIFKGIVDIKDYGFYSEMILKYELEQPSGLKENRLEAEKERVKTYIETKIALSKNSKTLKFKTIVNNKAKDQKLRVLFPISNKIEKYYTDISFDMIERKPLSRITLDAMKQKEVKVNNVPSDSFIYLPSEFSIIHVGLQEVEVASYSNEKDVVSLTAIRSVGWLSRDDIRTRGGGAGPKLETPEAQCIGEYTFEYALTFEEDFEAESKIFRAKPVVVQGNTIKEGYNNILSYDNKKVILSAFYKNRENQVIIRLYNLTNEVQKVDLTSKWNEITQIDLLDNDIKKVEEIYVNPKEILSLRLE